MEDIYPPESFCATKHLPFDVHFQKFGELFRHQNHKVDLDDESNTTEYLSVLRTFMEVELTEAEMRNLSKSCSIDLLTCPGENCHDFPIKIPEAASSRTKLPESYIDSEKSKHLEVVKCRKKLKKTLLLGNKRHYQQEVPFKPTQSPSNLTPCRETLLTLLIFRPFKFNYFFFRNTSEKFRYAHELLALGSTTLDQIRDVLICPIEEGMCKEVQSIDENVHLLGNPKLEYPSGFFFIDDIFYNDFRSPGAIDYSEPIRKWTKYKEIGDLKAQSMQGVQLKSLTPRFGYPYLYMHQGNCEHVIVFSDVRLLSADDCLHSSCYPHIKKVTKSITRRCFFCKVSYAKWICMNSDRLPQNKVFLCTDCCKSYNYIDGQKIGEFQLFPYYEKNVLSC